MVLEYLKLFVTFAKIGMFTIGGGYAMIPLIEREIVNKQWMNKEEFMEMFALTQSLPGVFAVNISIFVGYKLYKVGGSLVCIIRKTKCSCDLERNVLKRKTKRYRNTIFPKIFSTGLRRFFSYAKTGSEHHSDPVLSFCRFAPALTLYAYATSVAALYAATLDALTSLPRKARREPTPVSVLEAPSLAFALDTPPCAFA